MTTLVELIWTNASLPGRGGAADEPAWAATDSANSCVDSDSAAETVSGGTLAAVLNCAKTGQQSIDLRDFGLQLDSDETLVISASTTSGTVTVAASVTWVED
jgi:hypothetical protein